MQQTLQSIKLLLKYYDISGHGHLMKCSHMYKQNISDLPDIYDSFVETFNRKSLYFYFFKVGYKSLYFIITTVVEFVKHSVEYLFIVTIPLTDFSLLRKNDVSLMVVILYCLFFV